MCLMMARLAAAFPVRTRLSIATASPGTPAQRAAQAAKPSERPRNRALRRCRPRVSCGRRSRPDPENRRSSGSFTFPKRSDLRERLGPGHNRRQNQDQDLHQRIDPFPMLPRIA